MISYIIFTIKLMQEVLVLVSISATKININLLSGTID